MTDVDVIVTTTPGYLVREYARAKPSLRDRTEWNQTIKEAPDSNGR